MLTYYDAVKDKQGFIYSCDMLRLTFELPEEETTQKKIIAYFTDSNRTDIENYPICLKNFKYRNLVTCSLSPDVSYTFGFCFNGLNKSDSLRCFLEYNPNKVLSHSRAIVFKRDVNFLIDAGVSFELSRFDLAVDIPLARDDVFFIKDKRKYACEKASETNNTEWLGVRNSNGRVKLYNKALEAVVDADGVKLENLTRLEVTSDSFSYSHVLKLFPDVYQRTFQSSLPVDLSNTQLVLVEAIRQSQNPEVLLQRITDKRIRAKIKPYILPDNAKLILDSVSVKLIIDKTRSLVNLYWLGVL